MHGRIVTVQVNADQLDEAVEVYVNSVVPAGKQQPGFRGATLLVDHDSGKAVSITLWDSEAKMIEGQDNGYFTEQISKFASFLSRAPDQHGYEVVFDESV